MENSELTLPTNVEYERALLGHAMDRPEWLDLVLSDCPSECFSLDSHRRIWNVLRSMRDRGTPVDIVTVQAELTKLSLLAAVGGAGYVSDLTTGLIKQERSVTEKIRSLREMSARRQFIADVQIAVTKAYDTSKPLEATAGELDIDLASSKTDRGKTVQRADGIATAALDELFDPPPQASPLSTGIWPLDQATKGGIRPGQYWVIGALPGRGKTSLARQAVLANTLRKVPTLVFSVEMTASQWIQQSAATIAKVKTERLYGKEKLWETERVAMREAAAAFAENLFIDESSPLQIGELVSRARLAIRRHGVRLIVVDYLQILGAPQKELRERAMFVSDSLRQLAKSEQVAVIALSQLARPRQINDVPTMTQLKESGDIEAHAHLVALLHLPVSDEGEPTGEDTIVIAKQRMGRQGSIAVTYNRDFLTFGRREEQMPPPSEPTPGAGIRRVQ
jgi:replicative DNA helicase